MPLTLARPAFISFHEPGQILVAARRASGPISSLNPQALAEVQGLPDGRGLPASSFAILQEKSMECLACAWISLENHVPASPEQCRRHAGIKKFGSRPGSY